MKEAPKFEVRQTVVVVYSQPRHPDAVHEAIVQKVGTKWVTVNRLDWPGFDQRFDRQTLRIDGGGYSSPGRVYLSREDYDAEIERKSLLATLNAIFTMYHESECLTLDHLRRMVAIVDEAKEATHAETEV